MAAAAAAVAVVLPSPPAASLRSTKEGTQALVSGTCRPQTVASSWPPTAPARSSPATKEDRAFVLGGPELAKAAYDLGDVVEARKISNATAATKTAFDEQDSLFELVRRSSKDAAACEQMELAAMNFSGAGEWREVLSKLTERHVEYNLMVESKGGKRQSPKIRH